MEFRRTPDARFEGLPDWRYVPHYVEVDDFDGGSLRMAYVDEGARDARPIVLFHGEPTWSYLYRKMIPGLLASGHRVLAPDLIGMGRSDKPVRQIDYSYERHIRWMQAWTEAVAPRDAVWFGQDWGSMIGLAVVGNDPDRFAAIVLANGLMPDPDHMERILDVARTGSDPQAFSRWQAWIKGQTYIDCGEIIANGVPGAEQVGRTPLSPMERAAYNAPFPDGSYQAAALAFPSLVNSMSSEALRLLSAGWRNLERWEKPFVTAYGKADPILGWADAVFQKWVPGARGQPHRDFPNGTHFIQEQEPEALVAAIDAVMSKL